MQINGSHSIPNEEELDRLLPVVRPYWLDAGRPKEDVGRPGVRATWIGHSTLLAEVDGALVLTDPIFNARASPVSWAGGRVRFRDPGD